MSIIIINIAFNLGIIVASTCSEIKGSCRERIEHRKHQKEQKLKEEKEQNLMPNEQVIAIKFCIAWQPHRRWLVGNRLNLSLYSKETTYQEYLNIWQFKKQKERLRIRGSIIKALSAKRHEVLINERVKKRLS